MSAKITKEQKQKALEAIQEKGTMNAGAEAAGVTKRTLNNEMNRSLIFKKRVLEAREEGKRNMADIHLQFVHDVAEGKIDVKMPRLTAALAILNWVEPGFRGATTVQGKIEHDIKVITAIPRPKYDELPETNIVIEMPVSKPLLKDPREEP